MADSAKIFELMSNRKITQKQLSIEVGISQGNISDWKNGRSFPGGETLNKLADYFHVTTDYLLGRTEDKKGPPATVSSDEGAGSPLEEQLIWYVRRLTPDQQNFLLAQIKTMQERQ